MNLPFGGFFIGCRTIASSYACQTLMMHRLYPIAVVVFWLATMSWLVVAKVVPTLRGGDPPNHLAADVAQRRGLPPTVWEMRWNFSEIGWAASKVGEQPDGATEILSRVQFTEAPQTGSKTGMFLAAQLQQWAGIGGDFNLCIVNSSKLDPNRQLRQLHSKWYLGKNITADPRLEVTGDIVGRTLKLQVKMGETQLMTRSLPIDPQANVADEMSPHGYMPPLRLHQQWKTQYVSPLRSTTSPHYQMVAKVERYDSIVWDKRAVETLLVVYRRDEGAGSLAAEQYLGRLWVRPDDWMVLKQEAIVLGSRLSFVRMTDEKARPYIEELNKEWSADAPETPRLTQPDSLNPKSR